jgi:cell division protein ZapA (FtsZ GTPase activity inhibitor)
MSKKSIAVRIAGHDYKILSDGDPASLREIAKHVDQAMGRVRERTGTVDTLDVAVLTCLNLAREIFALRAQENAVVDGDRMRSLIDRVEAILAVEKTSDVEDSDEARGTSEADISASRSKGQKSTRTLDLPSVEALRDRATASSQAGEAGASDPSMSEPRVAAGGRERAS